MYCMHIFNFSPGRVFQSYQSLLVTRVQFTQNQIIKQRFFVVIYSTYTNLLFVMKNASLSSLSLTLFRSLSLPCLVLTSRHFFSKIGKFENRSALRPFERLYPGAPAYDQDNRPSSRASFGFGIFFRFFSLAQPEFEMYKNKTNPDLKINKN